MRVKIAHFINKQRLGWDLNPDLLRDRQSYEPLYYRDQVTESV